MRAPALALLCALSVPALLGVGCIADAGDVLFGDALSDLCAQHEDPGAQPIIDPSLSAREVSTLWAPETPPPAGCAPADGEVWADAVALHTVTRAAQRDIAAYAHATSELGRGLIAGLILENVSLLHPDDGAFENLVDFGRFAGMTARFDFTAGTGGAWRLQRNLSAAAAPAMTVLFHDGLSGQTIHADPFTLQSYLGGVQVRSSKPLDDMLQNWSLRSTFTFQWQSEGPLAGLLADGQPLPHVFSITVSLSDLVADTTYGAAADARLGPFASLTRMQLSARAALDEFRNGVHVAYDVEVARATVGALASGQALELSLTGAVAEYRGLSMTTRSDDLTYLGQFELAGSLQHAVRGKDVELDAVSSYGTGAMEAAEYWTCQSALEPILP
ncbi:MAG: hypothetical protein H6744_10085 [Deltaproteobacteria bacterium]|nr:hypothetical protein [Deltaproteobacteria bacterium]MCB9787026.1 hypothetical protein [Deltaproteobacteria bacterium]